MNTLRQFVSCLLAAAMPLAAHGQEQQLSPGAELKQVYSVRCETAIKAFARKLDAMNQTERKKIENAGSTLQALDGAWENGSQARDTYAKLAFAVDMHNSWIAPIHEIPPSFRLADSLVADALAKKRWEAIRVLLLPASADPEGLGWSRPEADDRGWRESSRCQSYEFLAILRWLQDPPADVAHIQTEWLAREAGKAGIDQAVQKTDRPYRFLHNDYEYVPLKFQNPASWPARARWAATQLGCTAVSNASPSLHRPLHGA